MLAATIAELAGSPPRACEALPVEEWVRWREAGIAERRGMVGSGMMLMTSGGVNPELLPVALQVQVR